MVADEEKQALKKEQEKPPPSWTDENNPINESPHISPPSRLSPFYPVSARRKLLFPLIKSRSYNPLSSTPTIITTSSATPIEASLLNDPPGTERLSSSSAENSANAGSAASSVWAGPSLNMTLPNPSQTHFHMVSSSAVAASIGTSHFPVDENVFVRASYERSNSPMSSTVRISHPPIVAPDVEKSVVDKSRISNAPSTPRVSATSRERFLQKFLPSQFIRRSHRHRQKNNSVSSIPSLSSPTSHSAPTSPKLSSQHSIPLSARSSHEDRLQTLQPLSLPALKSSESLPVTSNRVGLMLSLSQSSPVRRGRSSTVSSVSSDVPPRASHSQTHRPNAILSNRIRKESGHTTPAGKLSLDNDDDDDVVLPSCDSDSGDKYLRRLEAEDGGLAWYIRKLIESSDPIHLSALSAYVSSLPIAGVPLDMALRFLLLHLPLPKEQGSIYRLLEVFARHYHASNPTVVDSVDQIHILCYSILMLNTDVWNANNKTKMTKEQYVRNTSGQGVSEDILSCWYDNVTWTQFIDSTHPTLSKLRLSRTTVAERPTRPTLDTYTPLLDSRLDDLKIVYSTKGIQFSCALENSLYYSGTCPTIPVEEVYDILESSAKVILLHRGRAKNEGFVLNRVSMLPSLNGESTRLVKVGIFPRRERVGRFARGSGWQWIETGVILLETKIIFVKGELSLVKSLESPDTEFIPPLGNETFLDLTGTIAFYDTNVTGVTEYSLRLVSASGRSDVLCLPDEYTLNQWLCLINYLATVQSVLSPQEDPPPSSTGIRRRAGTIAPPAGRPVPLRAVSSTLELRGRSKSEQPIPPTPQENKLLLCTAFQKDLEAKLHFQRPAVDSLERQVRCLLMQTPLQDKTKVLVLSALERVTKRLKSTRIEMARGLCYAHVLDQLIDILTGRKIRLVEAETEEFQLPLLGFVENAKGHRKAASNDSVDTFLSSATLYTALNPTDDLPVRRIGEPSLTSTVNPDRMPSNSGHGSLNQYLKDERVALDGVSVQLEKPENTPVDACGTTNELSSRAKNSCPSANYGRVTHEGV